MIHHYQNFCFFLKKGSKDELGHSFSLINSLWRLSDTEISRVVRMTDR